MLDPSQRLPTSRPERTNILPWSLQLGWALCRGWKVPCTSFLCSRSPRCSGSPWHQHTKHLSLLLLTSSSGAFFQGHESTWPTPYAGRGVWMRLMLFSGISVCYLMIGVGMCVGEGGSLADNSPHALVWCSPKKTLVDRGSSKLFLPRASENGFSMEGCVCVWEGENSSPTRACNYHSWSSLPDCKLCWLFLWLPPVSHLC